MERKRSFRGICLTVCATALLALLSLGTGSAAAKGGMSLGVVDPLLWDYDASTQSTWWDRADAAGAAAGKLHLNWSGVAPRKPKHPRNPNDSAYYFAPYDQAVRNAAARDMEVVIDVSGAPRWAEGRKRPASAAAGSWKPDAKALGDFMFAVAKRYSGKVSDSKGRLPAVRDFQVWNEPNIPAYLSPQWKGKKSFSAPHYRKMLNAGYEGVKDANKKARVLTGGTSPYGDEPGGKRTRPLEFWRKVLCLRANGKVQKSGCPKKRARAHFDVFVHNPINTHGAPTKPTRDKDDISTADMGRLHKLLRTAERRGTVATRGKHPFWSGEIWYASKPPEATGLPLATQARYLQQTLYLMWKAGVSRTFVYTLRDRPNPVYPWDSDGMYFVNGKPKPALTAFRFPFVASRKGTKLQLWGMAPIPGTVAIDYRNGSGWKQIATAKAASNRNFTGKIKALGKGEVRARIGGRTSLPWALG